MYYYLGLHIVWHIGVGYLHEGALQHIGAQENSVIDDAEYIDNIVLQNKLNR